MNQNITDGVEGFPQQESQVPLQSEKAELSTEEAEIQRALGEILEKEKEFWSALSAAKTFFAEVIYSALTDDKEAFKNNYLSAITKQNEATILSLEVEIVRYRNAEYLYDNKGRKEYGEFSPKTLESFVKANQENILIHNKELKNHIEKFGKKFEQDAVSVMDEYRGIEFADRFGGLRRSGVGRFTLGPSGSNIVSDAPDYQKRPVFMVLGGFQSDDEEVNTPKQFVEKLQYGLVEQMSEMKKYNYDEGETKQIYQESDSGTQTALVFMEKAFDSGDVDTAAIAGAIVEFVSGDNEVLRNGLSKLSPDKQLVFPQRLSEEKKKIRALIDQK